MSKEKACPPLGAYNLKLTWQSSDESVRYFSVRRSLIRRTSFLPRAKPLKLKIAWDSFTRILTNIPVLLQSAHSTAPFRSL